MSHQDNVSRIKVVREGLGDLRDDVVFVGGSTVSFYADKETFEVRETDDVDVIIEVLNYSDHARFEENISKAWFFTRRQFKGKSALQDKGHNR